MESFSLLSDLKPEDGPAVVMGYCQLGPLADLLLSFGIIPGVQVRCAGWVPGSSSQILQFTDWQGVLRRDEAAIVKIRLKGQATL